VIGAAETSRNDKLRVAWEGLGNTRARRTNTANRAPNMLTHHHHVRAHVCASSIQCESQTNPYQSSETTTRINNVIGAAETSRNDKLRVAWEGLGNTRARRTNTANRAPNMHTHHHHVRAHVCASSIQWEIQTNPYQSSETTTRINNVIGAAETSRNDKLRVAWEGLGNTRARRANTANRAPNMHTHHHHVRAHVCTSSIQCESQTNPYQSDETTT